MTGHDWLDVNIFENIFTWYSGERVRDTHILNLLSG